MAYFSQLDNHYKLKYDCAVDHEKIKFPYSMPSAHHHAVYEFYFLDAGNRKYFASNKVFNIKPCQIVIFRPNVPHQVTMNLDIPYERHLLYATPALIDSVLLQNPQIQLDAETQLFNLSKKAYTNATKLLYRINSEIQNSDKYSPSAIKILLTELLILIFRNNDVSSIVVEKGDQRMQSVIDYILKNYANPITILDCAKIAYMSPSHFSREFHKTTAMTFKKFLNKIRVDASAEMLETSNHPISQVAQTAGFSSESYFGYVFKEFYGLSPLQYKVKKRNDRS